MDAIIDTVGGELQVQALRALKPGGVVLPLADAVGAHEILEGTRPRPPGKIVLRTA